MRTLHIRPAISLSMGEILKKFFLVATYLGDVVRLIHIPVYIYTHTCMCVYVCAYMYIYIYICIYMRA